MTFFLYKTKGTLRNYETLMKIIRSFEPGKIETENIDKLLEFWKNSSRIIEKIPKTFKGLMLIGQWVRSCIEIRLKNSTLNELQKEIMKKKKKLETFIIKLQENNAIILRLAEEKEFIKKSLDSFHEEKIIKDLKKFIKNKEKQLNEPLQNQKNLKILLSRVLNIKKRK